MKTYFQKLTRIRPFLAGLLLVITLSNLAPASVLANPFCALKYVASMWERGVTAWRQKLTDALDTRIRAALGGTAPIRRANWTDPDPEKRALQAGLDIEASMDRAEEVATSMLAGTTTPGPGIGTKTADAYVDVMTSERVLLSNADLDKAGAGVGRLAKHSNLTDEQMAELVSNTEPFRNPALRSADYDEAKWYRDYNELLTHPDLPNPPFISSEVYVSLRNNRTISGAGDFFEIPAALHVAKDKSKFGALKEIGADSGGSFQAGHKVDIYSENYIGQCALTNSTVKGKLVDDLETTMQGIVAAINHSRTALGKKRRFAFFHTGTLDNAGEAAGAGATRYAEYMNTWLAEKFPLSNIAVDYQIFTADDFISVPLQ